MAYVVARRGGRFEVRESLHTPVGPRARTLAGFSALTDQVLGAAARRAQRPFDAEAVIRSARRAGARVQVDGGRGSRARASFLAGSRNMAVSVGRPRSPRERGDPGAALLELLGFAGAVLAGQAPRPFEPLAFPPLARVAERSAVSAALAR